MSLASMFQKSKSPDNGWILDLIGKKALGDWYDAQMEDADEAKIRTIGDDLCKALSSLERAGLICGVPQPVPNSGVKFYTKSMLDYMELGNGVVDLPSPG